MKRRVLHEKEDIFTTHGDNDLFSRQSFGCHLDTRFGFVLAIDNVVYLIDLVGIEGWEHFLNFQNFRYAN